MAHVEGDLWRQPAENGRRSEPEWWLTGNRSSPCCSRTKRGAHHRPRRRHMKQASPSRRAFHTNDGQVASAGCEFNVDLDSRTGRASYQGDGPCTNRGSWPTLTRFVARFAIGWIVAGIDFIRRPSAQRHVWPMRVVPMNRQGDFAAEGALAQGHQRQTTEQRLERKDQSLDDCQAPVLADRAISWRLDTAALTPPLEGIAVELRPMVADDVAGCLAGCRDGSCCGENLRAICCHRRTPSNVNTRVESSWL